MFGMRSTLVLGATVVANAMLEVKLTCRRRPAIHAPRPAG